jgi:hypothetical protein
MKNPLWLCLVLFVACVAPGYGAQTTPQLKNIPLEWKATEAISSFAAIDMSVYRNEHFVIKPFSDVRNQPSEIGVNIEKRFSGQDLRVTTQQKVSDWLTRKCATVYSQFGLNVDNSNGTFFVDTSVVKFFVTEESKYNAEVSLEVTLTAKNRVIAWKGTTTGSATRFGHSYEAVNYYEALSNATISAVHGLLNNDSFRRAVSNNK